MHKKELSLGGENRSFNMRKSITQITLKEKLFGFHNHHHDDVEDFFHANNLVSMEGILKWVCLKIESAVIVYL